MEDWSDTKKECYNDFIAQMKLDGYIVKKNNKPKQRTKPWQVESFDLLRSIYPRTTARPAALNAWNKLKPSTKLIEKMTIHCQLAYRETDKEFIPHFSTYLNQHKWEDEIVIAKPKLLKLPAEDEKVWEFARKHTLPDPSSGEDYFQYRARLNGIIQRNQMLAK